MNLKQLFTMSRNKEVQKMYFIDENKKEYILTNFTKAISGLALYKVDDYCKISDNIRDINKIIKDFKVIK